MLLASIVVVTLLLSIVAPAAGQRAFLGPAAIPLQADTFTLQMNGQPVGTQIVTVVRTNGGFAFRETTTTPAGGQETEVDMDSTLAMKTVRQEGEMNGKAMRIDVRYTDGRARGVPGPEGMVDLIVDAVVPAGIVDDNVLMAPPPGLPWRDGARFEVPSFSSGRDVLLEYVLTVTGRERTEVAGEEIDAFRVQVTGDQPMILSVSAEAPHRLLRLQVVGTRMEVVRMGGGDR